MGKPAACLGMAKLLNDPLLCDVSHLVSRVNPTAKAWMDQFDPSAKLLFSPGFEYDICSSRFMVVRLLGVKRTGKSPSCAGLASFLEVFTDFSR